MTERVVDLCLGVFGALRPDPGYPWRLEMHQFRIEARPGEPVPMENDYGAFKAYLLKALKTV